jgi:hypothetical protein
MAGKKPVHMEAMLNLNPRDFKIRSQLNKDYIASFGSQYKRANILILTGEVSAPSRSVIATSEAKRKDPGYTGLWLWKWLPLILKSTPCKYIKNNIFHFEKKSFPMNVRLLTLKRWLSILDFSSYHVLQHICILKFDKLSNTIQVFY